MKDVATHGLDEAQKIAQRHARGRKRVRCAVCSEPIVRDGVWTHTHGDVECWTGDGSTACPPEVRK